MQQRLGIAQALVGRPAVLLLDEPTSALDPVGRRTVRELLEELRARGIAVLLNSHLLSEVELVCDRVAILLAGQLVAEGSPAELARPRGVEIETAVRACALPAARRGRTRRRSWPSWSPRGSRSTACACSATLEDVYLEAVRDRDVARLGSLARGKPCFPREPPSSRGRVGWGNLPVPLGPLHRS